MKNLYLVQDSDHPVYVIAESCGDALNKWKDKIKEENPDCYEDEDDPEPEGISLVARSFEILL